MFRVENTKEREGEREMVFRWAEWNGWGMRKPQACHIKKKLKESQCWVSLSLSLTHSPSPCMSQGWCCPTESTVRPTPVYYYLFKSMDSTTCNHLHPDELVCCVGGERIEWGGVPGCCWVTRLEDQGSVSLSGTGEENKRWILTGLQMTMNKWGKWRLLRDDWVRLPLCF